MSTHRTSMLEQLNDVFGAINPDTLIDSPTIVATLAMRDALVLQGLTWGDASVIVSKMTIKLPTDLFDDEDDKRITFEIIDNMAKMIGGLHKTLIPQLGSFDLFVNMVAGANLEIE